MRARTETEIDELVDAIAWAKPEHREVAVMLVRLSEVNYPEFERMRDYLFARMDAVLAKRS